MILRTDEPSDKRKPRENTRGAGGIEEGGPRGGDVRFLLNRSVRNLERGISSIRRSNSADESRRVLSSVVEASGSGEEAADSKSSNDSVRSVERERALVGSTGCDRLKTKERIKTRRRASRSAFGISSDFRTILGNKSIYYRSSIELYRDWSLPIFRARRARRGRAESDEVESARGSGRSASFGEGASSLGGG